MAQKRMFNNLVVGSDDFLEMPDSSQNLYFHLSMKADDDGFVDNWRSIMRMTGKKEDDLKILIAKSFVIPFDTGVLVIKHWRLNNYIRKDRYVETTHLAEKSLISTDSNLVYQMSTNGIPDGSIDKSSIDKISIDKNSSVDAEIKKIVNYYEDNIGQMGSYIFSEIESYLDDFNADVIIYAIEKAVDSNVKKWSYIKSILNNWHQSNLHTIAEVKAEKKPKKKEEQKIENRNYSEDFFNNLYTN